MSAKIRVLLVDDQALIRTGLQTLLNRKPDIEIIGQANDGSEAIRLVETHDPDVVLMDIRMPIMDGISATRILTARGPRPAVIILTTFHDDEDVFSGLSAGARGYLLKDVDHKTLADAIRTVAAGNALIQPEVTGQVLREFSRLSSDRATVRPAEPQLTGRLALLTERERAILRLLALGRTNQEISDTMIISVGTVKNHISNILSKLDVRDRTQAALIGQQAGLGES